LQIGLAMVAAEAYLGKVALGLFSPVLSTAKIGPFAGATVKLWDQPGTQQARISYSLELMLRSGGVSALWKIWSLALT
jgi:hypothetical protein